MQDLPEKLYTASQVRAMDRIAIEEKGIAGFELMTRAGIAIFEQIRSRWPTVNRLLVYCGAGNNAGDGYVVATLARAAGYQVTVISLTEPQRLRGEALTASQGFIQAGGRITPFHAPIRSEPCIVVDALLGTGLDRTVRNSYAEAIASMNAADNPVIAVDIPSGLHADSGQVMGCAVRAQCTVSFIALKQGLFTGEAAEFCGEIIYADLAVPADVPEKFHHSAQLLRKFKLPPRHRSAHKGHNGHVLLVGGDRGYSGAIRLAAEAALRSGAGLVSVATREAHSHVINSSRPEIMSHGVETVEQLKDLLARANVVVIGPGLGQSSWAQAMFSLVRTSGITCVADADALTLLARLQQRHENWIITPHPGEAARLLQLSTEDIATDRFTAVSMLQQRYGGVALLKGAGSLIKGEHDLYVSTTGNPGMASGGMGDVLAGMIGALIAQGLDRLTATQVAVHTHGEAADAAAVMAGERGLLASDLMPFIRTLLN